MDYALSQKNNHAFSEACGLILIASLFPELRDAEKWRKRAHRVIVDEIERQVYADGSYVQHSFNYQRVMLQTSILALRLAELAGEPFPTRVYQKVGACGQFLFELMEPQTGQLPLYGNNDGAYVLPLSECDSLDYRPVIQATHYLVNRQLLLPRGAWDEDLLWLFGAGALRETDESRAPVAASSRAFAAGGYYTIRRSDTFAMMRCHTFKDRPAHYDQLHLDLWFHDQNVLQDCGTFKYYFPERPDVEYYFKSIRAHNTIELDGGNPLELVSRFLWLPWPRGRPRRVRLESEDVQSLELEHYDYDRSPWHTIHRRTLVSFPTGLWVIVDDLIGGGPHDAVLRWQLLDAPYQLSPERDSLLLHTPRGDYGISVTAHPTACSGMQLTRGCGDAVHVAGLRSPYYGQLDPITTLEIGCGGMLPRRIVSAMGPGSPPRSKLSEGFGDRQRWHITWNNQRYCLDLHDPRRESRQTLLASSIV
jgi:hypothetical protein